MKRLKAISEAGPRPSHPSTNREGRPPELSPPGPSGRRGPARTGKGVRGVRPSPQPPQRQEPRARSALTQHWHQPIPTASSKQRPPLLAASAPASRALLGNGFPRLSSSSCHWLARTQVPGGHRPLPVPSSPSPPLPRPGRPERSRGLLLLARPCGLRRTLALGCFERRRYRVLEASHLQHSPVPTSATAD